MFQNVFADFSQATSGVFTTEELPSSDMAGSSWNKYVYRVYSGSNVDQDRCTAMCAFDQPKVDGSNCHFTVVEGNICYLGTLGVETNLLANTTSSALRLKTSMSNICLLFNNVFTP